MCLVVLGGVMVSVLVIGCKIAGSNPAEGDGFFGEIKICSMHSFGGKVKPSAPHIEFYGMLKSLRKKNRYFVRQNSPFPSKVPLALLLDDWWWSCHRALVVESFVPCRHHSTMVLHADISLGG
jgi:hypothetical protein